MIVSLRLIFFCLLCTDSHTRVRAHAWPTAAIFLLVSPVLSCGWFACITVPPTALLDVLRLLGSVAPFRAPLRGLLLSLLALLCCPVVLLLPLLSLLALVAPLSLLTFRSLFLVDGRLCRVKGPCGLGSHAGYRKSGA